MTNHLNVASKRLGRRGAKMCETHLVEELDRQVATITISDPAALVVLAREAPVFAAREAQIAMTTLDVGFKQHRVGIIGAGYASAYHMIRTDGAWEQFIKDLGWSDLSRPPKNTMQAKNKMLLHVMRYVFRAESGKTRRRVRVYAGMLQDRFDKGFKPEGVITLINTRGIEALRKEGVTLRKKGAKDTYFDDLNELEDDQSDILSELPQPKRGKLTPAQIGKCVVALEAFNAKMLQYLAEQAKPPAMTRSRSIA